MSGNIYYDPDEFGLSVVAEVDEGGSYEFDKFVVFRREDGRLVYGEDSGCSCPTPFESRSHTDLGELGSYDEFSRIYEEWAKGRAYGGTPTLDADFKSKVREAFAVRT